MKNLSTKTIKRLQTIACAIMWAQMLAVLVWAVVNSPAIVKLITQNR